MSESTNTPEKKNSFVTKVVKHRKSIAAFTAGVAAVVAITHYVNSSTSLLDAASIPVD